MDQTNPLAELTHKRRLSAPSARAASRASAPASRCATCTTRSTAGCARSRRRKVRTSASSPASRPIARVNDLGFIETPLAGGARRARSPARSAGSSASEEEDFAVAQANTRLESRRHLRATRWCCAASGTTTRSLPPERIDYMDVAPEQLVSIAAALIPFLEHDDANRALMGSNMQRQSVPLLNPAGAAGRHRARGEGGRRLRRRGDRAAGRRRSRASRPTRSSSTPAPARRAGRDRAIRWRGSRSTTATG